MKIFQEKEMKNAGWLIGGHIAQMVISFFVSILTARYLGPSNYGLIGYVSAYVSFFTSFCMLGINYVIVKDLLNDPENQGKAIGTSIVLRVISSLLSSIMIVGIISIIDYGETETIIVAVLCCISLFFQAFGTINYWFQSLYQSKTTAIIGFIAYIVVALSRILLLVLQKDVKWFAFASSLDSVLVAVMLLIAYKKSCPQKLKFSLKKGKDILNRSKHYIVSGMMVAIYTQTDKMMLKQMLGTTEVGYYTLAASISVLWAFVITAIIDSMTPTILDLANKDRELFDKKNKQLYAIIFYVSVFISILYVIFGELIIKILYGSDYLPAASSLRIITWYVAFSYLGVARNAWIVSMEKQKYLKYMYFSAAILNIGLNFLFIPIMQSAGAALASLITQIFTSILLPMFIKEMRPNAILMLEAITFKGVFDKNKS